MADELINISYLQEEAKTYQKELRFLPFTLLLPELTRLGISLLQVANKDTRYVSERKGGILRPYSVGIYVEKQKEIIRLKPRELEVKTSYISMEDHVKNYKAAKILNNPQAGTGINQTKEHPLKNLVSTEILKTVSEDILDALCFGERDEADLSPLGCFDGYYTLIDNEVAANEVSVAKNNLVATGTIAAPVDEDDYDAIEKIILFVRSTNRALRTGKSILYISQMVYFAALDAYKNKMKYVNPDLNGLQNYINENCGSQITIVISPIFGIGDLMILTVPGNFDFGMDTFGDEQFLQYRTPYTDPNIFQIWLQADFGTRINSIHAKTFCINDGTHTAESLSGDYQDEIVVPPPVIP